MGRIANLLWSLAVGVLLAAAALARDMNTLLAVGIALVGAAAVFSFLDWWKSPGRRAFIETPINAAFLDALFAKRTAIQSNRAIKIYIGKWVKLRGTVNNVEKHSPWRATVTLERGGGLRQPMIFARFRGGVGKLEVLHVGDTVHIQGRIAHIENSWVSLFGCELLGVNEAAPDISG